MKVDLQSIAFSLLSFWTSTTPRSTTVKLKPVRATTIYGGLVDGDFAANMCGVGEGLPFGTMTSGIVRRALLQFDIAGSIPPGSTINSVALDVEINNLGDIQDYAASLHRATTDWNDGTNKCNPAGEGVPADNSSGDGTRLEAMFQPVAWCRAGGDFARAASASAPITNRTGNGAVITWWSNSGMAVDVQSWLDKPSANRGWIVAGGEAQNSSIRYIASEEAINATLTVELDHRGALDHYVRAALHWMNALLKEWQGTGAGCGMDRFRAERYHWTSDVDRGRIVYHRCAAAKRWKRPAAEGAEPSSCKEWASWVKQ